MLERVVQLVYVATHRIAATDISHQPEFLLIADMRQVPHEWTHQRGMLSDQFGIVDAVETVTTVFERERQDGERFLDTYRRIGMNPFKEALYG